MAKYEHNDKGKEIKVSFCPRCRSRSVGYVFGLGNLFGTMPKMKCRDCGFSMSSFPILVVSEKDLARDARKDKKKNVRRKKK